MSALGARLAQRRAASGQLLHLIRRGGAGRVSAALLVHLVSGAMPIVFLVGIGVGLTAAAPSVALVVALSAFALQQLLAPVQFALSQGVARRVDAYCSSRLVRHALVDIPPRALELPEIADGLQEATDSLAQQRLTPGMAAEGALALVARYTQLVGAAVVLAWCVNVWTAAAAVLVALVGRFGQTEAFHRWGRVVGTLGPARRRTNYIRDLGTGTRAAKEIRTLGLVDWLEQRYRAESDAMLRPLWSTRRRIYGRPFLLYAALGLVGGVTALALVVAGLDGGAVARLVMAVQVVVLCVRFGAIFPESDVKLVYGRSAWQAMLRGEEAARQVEPPPGGTAPAPAVAAGIRLQQLTFGYQAGRPVLDGLDLTLAAGRSVAVVGVNGAGKSTLIKLISGLYQPQSGSVLVDGTDLRDVDLAGWQARLAVTFQDFVRYRLTLRDNVAINAIVHRADDEGLLECLRRAGLGELLDDSELTLETPLSRLLPGGTDLSGGQWQRVALARALFAVRHGARLLVLDEPTAQLDARAEAAFYDTFLDLTAGVTSVIISHRFSTVRRADLIVVLDAGRITEQGTHDELLARGGHYAEMFRAQARRFAVGSGGRR